MTFSLSDKSLSFVSHVDPRLVAVAKLAITLSEEDFGFTEEQSRTLAQQQVMVDRGVSHTLKSHHIIDCIAPGHWAQPGCSGAVDAVPWNGTAFVWEWPRVYRVASAFSRASAQLVTPITWGGVWDKLMSEYGTSAAEIQEASAAYVARQRAAGNPRPFVDGVHWELGAN